MKTYALFSAGMLAVAGVLASVALMPREGELALMRFKDKRYSEALADYQRLWAKGDRTIATLVPLTRLYLAYGEVNQAVEMMEAFVERHPENLEARRQLGRYYQYAQRPRDYLRNLEVMTELHTAEEDLRELSDGYNFIGRFEDQIKVLKRLIELDPGHPEDYISLAHLQAAQGRVEDGFRTMLALAERHPQAIDSDLMELTVSLGLDARRPRQALRQAQQWLLENVALPGESVEIRRRRRQMGWVASLAAVFRFKEHPWRAMRLLRPFEPLVEDHEPLLVQQVWLQLELGRERQAYQRLRRLERRGRVPLRLHAAYLEAALKLKEFEDAFRLAGRLSLSAAPDWLIVELVQEALRHGRSDLARQVAGMRGADFLPGHPLVAADLALASGDLGGLRKWLRAAASRPLSQREKLHLAYLYQQSGQPQGAIELLEKALRERSGSDAALELASLYLEQGQGQRGFRYFHNLRRNHTGRPVQAGWAILAASQGHEDPVIEWFGDAATGRGDRPWMRDLYYVASDARLFRLSERVARRLVSLDPSLPHRLMMAEALLRNERVDRALAAVRPLLGEKSPQARAVYQEALIAAWRSGRPVRQELKRFWKGRLENLDPRGPAWEEAIHGLLEIGAGPAILPELRGLAGSDPSKWLWACIEAHKESGRLGELTEFLLSGLTPPRGLARATEMTVLCGLDRQSSLLWESRVRLQALIELGVEEAILPHLRAFARAQHRGCFEGLDTEKAADWAFAYEQALRRSGRGEELTAYWRWQAGLSGVSRLRRRTLGFQLLEAGERQAAIEVFRRLAEEEPARGENVEQLLHLWGTPPGDEALSWIESRFREASTARQKAAWLNRLIEAQAPGRAARLASTSRGVPGDWTLVVDAHMKALAQARDLQGLARLLRREIPLARDPQRLEGLAGLGMENGLPGEAEIAYRRLLERDGRHPAALAWLGKRLFERGAYTKARSLLGRLEEGPGADFEALYYLGELARRRGDSDAAQSYYQGASRRARGLLRSGGLPADGRRQARSVLAHVLYRQGRQGEAETLFQELIAEDPRDLHLRADYAGLLLEERRYAAANRILEGVQAAVAPLPATLVASMRPAGAPLEAWKELDLPSLRGGRLRLQLLRVQLDAQLGRLGEAEEGIENLRRSHSGNPQVLAAAAQVAHLLNRSRQAWALSAEAVRRAPQNEDFQELHRELDRPLGSQASAGFEFKTVENAQREFRWNLLGRYSLNPGWLIVARFQESLAEADRVQFNDGRVGAFDDRRSRGSLALSYEAMDGTRVEAFVHGGREGLGGGAKLARPDSSGVSHVSAEVARPYWEYLEGLANGLARDRVEAGREQRLTGRLRGSLKAAYNRYRSGRFDPAATSLAWEGVLRYELREDEFWAGYGVEAEYERSLAEARRGDGTRFNPLPLTSREVHFLDFSWARSLRPTVHADSFAGYSWDRLGGAGPFLGGNLQFDPKGPLSGRLFFDQRLNSADTGQKETRMGLQIRWSFDE